jgi:putative flavoprotein involved in K+ transport
VYTAASAAHGPLAGIQLGDGAAGNLEAADEVSENIKRSIDGFIAKREVEAPAEAPYMPVSQPRTSPAPKRRAAATAMQSRRTRLVGCVFQIGEFDCF